jgi:mono/diheme cytochrome c family protein
MKSSVLIALWLFILMFTLGMAAASPRTDTSTEPVVRNSAEAESMRLEGEKRFRANCGRCHAAPQKFPPRMMATIVRHMRVRATITDEDMRLVLLYMTQ